MIRWICKIRKLADKNYLNCLKYVTNISRIFYLKNVYKVHVFIYACLSQFGTLWNYKSHKELQKWYTLKSLTLILLIWLFLTYMRSFHNIRKFSAVSAFSNALETTQTSGKCKITECSSEHFFSEIFICYSFFPLFYFRTILTFFEHSFEKDSFVSIRKRNWNYLQ